jgi:hypothetical protein
MEKQQKCVLHRPCKAEVVGSSPTFSTFTDTHAHDTSTTKPLQIKPLAEVSPQVPLHQNTTFKHQNDTFMYEECVTYPA